MRFMKNGSAQSEVNEILPESPEQQKIEKVCVSFLWGLSALETFKST